MKRGGSLSDCLKLKLQLSNGGRKSAVLALHNKSVSLVMPFCRYTCQHLIAGMHLAQLISHKPLSIMISAVYFIPSSIGFLFIFLAFHDASCEISSYEFPSLASSKPMHTVWFLIFIHSSRLSGMIWWLACMCSPYSPPSYLILTLPLLYTLSSFLHLGFLFILPRHILPDIFL